MTGLWIAVGLLGALLVSGMAGMFLLLAMGRLHLDLGWGRSIHDLGPIEIRIDAPRDVLFEVISSPYLGRTLGRSGIEVLAKGADLAVAVHNTKVHFYRARTVEVIEFEAPARVGFRHLTGPVPHAIEEFMLEEAEGGTDLRYAGELGIDFFFLGRLAGRYWVRPNWERAVREHLEHLKRRAEQRAERESARQRSPSPGQVSS
jgi:hypothetical protein